MFDRKSASFMKMRDVVKRTGKSRSTIYAEIKEGTFPPPIHTGLRSVAWLSSDIDEWIEFCVKATRSLVNEPDEHHRATGNLAQSYSKLKQACFSVRSEEAYPGAENKSGKGKGSDFPTV